MFYNQCTKKTSIKAHLPILRRGCRHRRRNIAHRLRKLGLSLGKEANTFQILSHLRKTKLTPLSSFYPKKSGSWWRSHVPPLLCINGMWCSSDPFSIGCSKTSVKKTTGSASSMSPKRSSSGGSSGRSSGASISRSSGWKMVKNAKKIPEGTTFYVPAWLHPK